MHKHFFGFLLLLFIIFEFSTTEGYDFQSELYEEGFYDTNSLIDENIKMITENEKYKDFKIDSTKTKGKFLKIRLYDGVIKGISTLHRTGNCTLKVADDLDMTVKCFVGVDFTNLKAHLSMFPLIHGRFFIVNAKTKEIETFIVVSTNFSAKVQIPKIHKFEITKMEDLHVWKNGVPIIDTFVNMFLGVFTKLFKNIIMKIMSKVVPKVLQEFFNSMAAENSTSSITEPVTTTAETISSTVNITAGTVNTAAVTI